MQKISEMTQTRLYYLKNVLGICSVMGDLSLDPFSKSDHGQLYYQAQNHGKVLFMTSSFEDHLQLLHSEELQLLEKIIIALKLSFSNVDIVTWAIDRNLFSMESLKKVLQGHQYQYIFYFGTEGLSLVTQKQKSLHQEISEGNVSFFVTLHPQEMLQKPEIKKEIWAGLQKVISNLPR